MTTTTRRRRPVAGLDDQVAAAVASERARVLEALPAPLTVEPEASGPRRAFASGYGAAIDHVREALARAWRSR